MSKQAVLERRRAARIEAERAAAARETRTKRLWRLGAVAAAAVVLAVVAIAVSSSGGAKPAPPATTSSLLAGIPENHGVLGDPKAPVTVTEYVDLQCPVCARASQSTIPAVIRDQVRAGKVKLAASARCSFLGEDSVRAARVAAGAERQGRLWAFLEAFYARQGTENSGYVTDGFLRDVAKAAGVDAGQAIGQADSAFASGRLQRADADAARMNVQGTPTLTVERGERAGARADGEPARRRRRAGGARSRGGPMRAAAIGVALAGLGIATYLTVVHYSGGDAGVRGRARLRDRPAIRLRRAGGRARRAARRCSATSASSPRCSSTGRAGGRAAAFLSLGGLGLLSVWLTYVEVGILDAICIWCVGSAICMAAARGADQFSVRPRAGHDRGVRQRPQGALRDPVAWTTASADRQDRRGGGASWLIAVDVFGLAQPFLAPWAALLTVHATVYRTFRARRPAGRRDGARRPARLRRRLGCSASTPSSLGVVLLVALLAGHWPQPARRSRPRRRRRRWWSCSRATRTTRGALARAAGSTP